MTLWLIIDVDNNCWRKYHGFRGRVGDGPNVVPVSFFKDIASWQQRFDTLAVAFCFDSATSKRKEIYPQYKANRHKNQTEEERQERVRLHQQIDLLRTDYLPAAGYRNIFHQEGYEADDLIASVVAGLGRDDEAIMISSDHDLYQLLEGKRIIQWKPQHQRAYTEASLAEEFYGIAPHKWGRVKAIAGCTSDNIQGVEGVGEITAAKYVTRQLKLSSAAYNRIEANLDYTAHNLLLTELPFINTQACLLRADRVTDKKLATVLRHLGLREERLPQGFGLEKS